jgi:RNA polymerase sigma-70 factor, ECF subfamily
MLMGKGRGLEETGSGTERSDKWLVQETLAGNKDAFSVLHRRYYARIYRLALFRTRSATDAEDIAAETFVKAITHLASYRFQGTTLFPWLARIASNLVVDMTRRQSGMAAVSLDSTTSGQLRALIEGLPSSAPDPYALAERQETQALVRNAILGLPREQSEAVLLRYLGDLTLKEIADAMGKTEGAIKSLLHRALANLRHRLVEGEQEAAQFGARRAQITAQTATESNRHTQDARRGHNLEIDDGDD